MIRFGFDPNGSKFFWFESDLESINVWFDPIWFGSDPQIRIKSDFFWNTIWTRHVLPQHTLNKKKKKKKTPSDSFSTNQRLCIPVGAATEANHTSTRNSSKNKKNSHTKKDELAKSRADSTRKKRKAKDQTKISKRETLT